ncbi:TBC domain-containing protein [Cordyceps javanica]|uniref:TBC domain-containing protein n=1 Tax=Cordyceps javanica TaxID=43265 RepID=A0A545UP33_9HYPO|nr:TBC domain-containing protein [Cordyceps javanica]TQW02984.1 TBC domain-containing protein [Cordyceps javanica]
MAPPTRFSSTRTGSRPAVIRKPTFRDDSGLVGLRYDKTVAAEPPLHMTSTQARPRARSRPPPPRPTAMQRSPSSSTTATRSSVYSCAASVSGASLTGTASTSIHGFVVCPPLPQLPVGVGVGVGAGAGADADAGAGAGAVPARASGPVVVVPPTRLNLPVLAPPTEKHPALRSPPPPPPTDECKRDSGHGSAVMTDTIPEEERFHTAAVNRHHDHDDDDDNADDDNKNRTQNDDSFVEKRRPMSRHATWTGIPVSSSFVSSSPNTAPAVAQRRRRQSANDVARPAPTRATISTTGTWYLTSTAAAAAAPSKMGISATEEPTNGSPATATAARASSSSSHSSFNTSPPPLTVIAPLGSRIASAAAASTSSSFSSYNNRPATAVAAAITTSDFPPVPISPPLSPSRAPSRRKLLKRHSLRLSFWGGSRDDDASTTPTTTSHPRHHHQRDEPASSRAPRRWHSSSHLRGDLTAGNYINNNNPTNPVFIPARGANGAAAPPPGTATPAPASSAKLQSLLELPVSPARSSSRSSRAMSSSSSPDMDRGTAAEFSPLGIAIPTDSLLDDDFLASLHFSKRGSLMFNPDNISAMDRLSLTDDDRSATPTQKSSIAAAPRPASSATSHAASDEILGAPARLASPSPDVPFIAPDVEQESQKVRQLYASGDCPASARDNVRHSYCERLEPTPEVLTEDDESFANGNILAPASSVPNYASSSPLSNNDAPRREPADPAGGFEDWDDLDSAMVDRYGFIGTPRSQSRVGTPTEMRSLHHSPRRRHVLTKRDPMGFASSQGGMHLPSRKISARSLNTQHSHVSAVSFRSSRSVIRQAGNLLPQNRNRRWMDEAGDMLTVSPNLQDSVEEARVEKISEALKRKEIERSEKWRRMARIIRRGEQGQGMEFDFDTKNPKLVERTWKGIPDRWRAAAWWSFLATSAREHPGSSPTEESITASFRRLQDCASADDIQIDLDVPRTISRHVMFRRRYRGGQRLLFRVLHALSLYFPETGYVQGMASLAATLLCYFDEEKCFVMLVRMWQLRGLERLYQPGFDGLMAALRELETGWLHKDVARKMADLCIDGTAYGTRWYLTLFNLSIPFAAQLRVWDVFLLLGDAATGELTPAAAAHTTTTKPSTTTPPSLPSIKESPSHASGISKATTAASPSSGLDVLHATSAALIQALREVLLDADFENAMKALTAWIPIKDEDLLMKVARAEWKTQLKRRS